MKVTVPTTIEEVIRVKSFVQKLNELCKTYGVYPVGQGQFGIELLTDRFVSVEVKGEADDEIVESVAHIEDSPFWVEFDATDKEYDLATLKIGSVQRRKSKINP